MLSLALGFKCGGSQCCCLCSACCQGDWLLPYLFNSQTCCLAAALPVQVSLTTNDWDECAAWLTALKRLIKARHTMG